MEMKQSSLLPYTTIDLPSISSAVISHQISATENSTDCSNGSIVMDSNTSSGIPSSMHIKPTKKRISKATSKKEVKGNRSKRSKTIADHGNDATILDTNNAITAIASSIIISMKKGPYELRVRKKEPVMCALDTSAPQGFYFPNADNKEPPVRLLLYFAKCAWLLSNECICQ
jgi:hypothetical protein